MTTPIPFRRPRWGDDLDGTRRRNPARRGGNISSAKIQGRYKRMHLALSPLDYAKRSRLLWSRATLAEDFSSRKYLLDSAGCLVAHRWAAGCSGNCRGREPKLRATDDKSFNPEKLYAALPRRLANGVNVVVDSLTLYSCRMQVFV